MAASILLDKKRLVPVAAYLNGEFGYKGVFVGVPVILGAAGVEKIVELELNSEERAAFEKSVGAVQELMEQVDKLLK